MLTAMRMLVLLIVAACSSAAPPAPAAPAPVSHPADAAVDVAVDAPDPAASASPWIFRFHTKDRTETWTLRFAGGRALIDVESATGTVHYAGTATEGSSIAIAVETTSAKLALDCTYAQHELGAKCNDRTAKPLDVLECFVEGFATPMVFARAPGAEYVADAMCTGYRLLNP